MARHFPAALFACATCFGAAHAQDALQAYLQLPRPQNDAIALIDIAMRDAALCNLKADRNRLVEGYRTSMLREGASEPHADHFRKTAHNYFVFADSIQPKVFADPSACPPAGRVVVQDLLKRLAAGDFTHHP
jgi:hypothetical protein